MKNAKELEIMEVNMKHFKMICACGYNDYIFKVGTKYIHIIRKYADFGQWKTDKEKHLLNLLTCENAKPI